MDKELEEMVKEFHEKLTAYENANGVFVEIWKSQMSAKDGLRVEIKKQFARPSLEVAA